VQSIFHHCEPSAIIALFRVLNNRIGNLPPLPAIFPDWEAPIVRTKNGDRALAMARWGYAWPAPIWRRTGREHSEHKLSALAWMAKARVQMFGSGE
jgi:hypothetical protein